MASDRSRAEWELSEQEPDQPVEGHPHQGRSSQRAGLQGEEEGGKGREKFVRSEMLSMKWRINYMPARYLNAIL